MCHFSYIKIKLRQTVRGYDVFGVFRPEFDIKWTRGYQNCSVAKLAPLNKVLF